MLSASRLQVGRMGNRSRLLYVVLRRNPLHNGRGLEPILELPFFFLPDSVSFDEKERDDRDYQQENDGNEDRFEQDLQDTHNDGGDTIEGEQLMVGQGNSMFSGGWKSETCERKLLHGFIFWTALVDS
ncbi:hypothetical protein BDV33DRAFT_204984 [Aspergillus novoparasiticus]|uniref:Uncharacterized protein n=1 Tax=Aspergillus novoparasiticus TaxID=986946 RepID=A0A5N6ENN7_9EURO|nr:hypothetical protein BDV33DRAFT_204984 [Aspergillus novoparasiticus]